MMFVSLLNVCHVHVLVMGSCHVHGNFYTNAAVTDDE